MDRLEQFLSDLLDVNPNIDLGLIESAYNKANQMHAGQLRKSLEPYIVHPVEVAKILADLGMDDMTIVAGLLHDAVEDTPYSIEEVKKDFGSQIAFLVNGVTKLGSIIYESKEERRAENLRKMFLAISKDIRVLIIKLADRLHNLRTINYMSQEQIADKCRETLEIYAPLASRLGIYAIKFELEDIALKYLDPVSYYELVNEVKDRKSEREARIEKVIEEIRTVISEYKINCEITGRSKHFYSIYTKMKEQNKPLDEIFDLMAVRIIVESVRDCYAVLGMVHTLWRPMPGRFKDYIAMPKPNMYQSLHTTLIGEDGQPFEIQIRTRAMHRVAEYGIAAHWKYKEGGPESDQQEELKLAWIRQTLEWNRDMNDPREYMETMRTDLFSNQVFVFTPKGDVIELPAGSTPLDLAFKIHSDVGIKCTGARVNAKMVPIDYVLQNGEVIEIVTSNSSKGPSMDWLNIAKSAGARSKIRQWLKKQDRGANIERGREILEKAAKRKGYDTEEIVRTHWLAKIAKQMNYTTVNELYTSLSYGGAIVGKVVGKLADMYREEYETKVLAERAENVPQPPKPKAGKRQERQSETRVIADGMSGMLIRLSKCCSPVPGDEIVGYITKGRGISVHRADCPNITSLPEAERARFVPVEWDRTKDFGTFSADILIMANDRKGLFADVSRACVDMDVNISGVNLRTNSDNTVSITMTLAISNVGEMTKILSKLRQVESVLEVYRARG